MKDACYDLVGTIVETDYYGMTVITGNTSKEIRYYFKDNRVEIVCGKEDKPKTVEYVSEMSKNQEFACLANCYIDTIALFNKLMDELRKNFGGGSRMFTMALDRILKDKEEIISLERELEEKGYSKQDAFMWECDKYIVGYKE